MTNVLSRAVTPSPRSPETGRVTSAVVRVAEDDRFFFDHPLDHVPAMLLVDSCLRAAVSTVASGSTVEYRVRRAKFRFQKFCEKDRPTVARLVTAAEPYERRIEVVQDGVTVCDGRITLTPGLDPRWTARPAEDAARAEKDLVHKHAADQVLIGPLSETADGHVSSVVAAVPRDRIPPLHPLSPLVEAVRQAVAQVSHTVAGVPVGAQFVVNSVEVDLPSGAAPGGRVQLRSRDGEADRRHFDLPMDVLVNGRQLGRIGFAGRTVSRAAYERLRADRARRTEAAR